MIDTLFFDSVIQEQLKYAFPSSRLLSYQLRDLNMDGKNDLVAVITRSCDGDEQSIGSHADFPVCRKVVIFLNDGEYEITAFDDHVVDCSKCGGGLNYHDAFVELTTGFGWIAVLNTYGNCEREFVYQRYKYDSKKQGWFLDERVVELYSCPTESMPESILMKKYTETAIEFGVIEFGK